jgi:alpha-mannosidase
LVPFGGDYLDAKLKDLSQEFRVPVASIQGVVDSCVPGGRSLVEHSSEFTCLSAIKKHEERNTLVLRIWNLRGEESTDTLEFGCDVTAAWRTDLHENRVEVLTPVNAQTLHLALAPHEILTVEVEFAN